MTQQEKVLKYLKKHKNGASFIELTQKLYIANVREVVRLLRDKGHNIEMEERKKNNSKYNVYILRDSNN